MHKLNKKITVVPYGFITYKNLIWKAGVRLVREAEEKNIIPRETHCILLVCYKCVLYPADQLEKRVVVLVWQQGAEWS